MILFLAAGIVSWRNHRTPSAVSAEAVAYVDHTFNLNVTCDDSDENRIDVGEIARQNPELMIYRKGFAYGGMPEGCWGKVMIFPQPFNAGMCWQPDPLKDGANKDWRFYIEFLNPDGSVFAIRGPIRANDRPFFDHYPMTFRLQGHVPGILFKIGHKAMNGSCIQSS